MKKLTKSRKQACDIRHERTLKKLKKNSNKLPRLIVTKTNGHIFAQIFDDAKGVTIVSSSSLQLDLKNGNIASAKLVGADVAKKAVAKDIKKITFDRGGNKYHGRVEAIANAARENGLEF